MPDVSSLHSQDLANLSLSWARSVPTNLGSVLILFCHLRLGFPELFCTGSRSGGESDANVEEELCKLEKGRIEKYVTVLWCFCAGTIPSRPTLSSPHEGWSSLCGRDCFLSVPCPPFLLIQTELSSLYPYRISLLLNLTMKMEAVCCSETLLCICRTTWFHTDSSVLWLRYGLDDRRFESWEDQDTFMSPSTSRPVVGPTDLPMELCPGSFPWLMRPERESDASIERRC